MPNVRLTYADEPPAHVRYLANSPLAASRYQAALDMAASGVSYVEMAWAFGVTHGGMNQLMERARAWQDWRMGMGRQRFRQVQQYMTGAEGQGIPGAATRWPRESLFANDPDA
jgi:hypothetical protein